MTSLKIQNLDVQHGQLKAVRNLSLTVQTGEVVALIGANGAGKLPYWDQLPESIGLLVAAFS